MTAHLYLTIDSKYKLSRFQISNHADKRIKHTVVQFFCPQAANKQDILSFVNSLRLPTISKVVINFPAARIQRKLQTKPFSEIVDAVQESCRFVTDLQIKHFSSIFQLQQSTPFPFLKRLNLFCVQIPTQALKLLSKCNFQYLSWLDIRKTNIKNQGIQIISKGNWPNLVYLSIRQCNFTIDGLRYLFKHRFDKLKTMALKEKLGFEGQRKCLHLPTSKLIIDVNESLEIPLNRTYANEVCKLPKIKVVKKNLSLLKLYTNKMIIVLLQS